MTAALNTQITKTSSEWVTDNPILGKDIIGVEITPGNTLRYKRGDGITTWDGLNYIDIAGDYITAETDPTVPAWAKETSKPTYTASEVGAAPLSHANDTDIHVSTAEKTSWNSKAAGDHNHDNVYQPIGSYLTSESDPTVPSWAKQIDIRINPHIRPQKLGRPRRAIITIPPTLPSATAMIAPFMSPPRIRQTGIIKRIQTMSIQHQT